MKKLSKLLLLTPLVPLSLVSCVSQGSTEEHKNNKNNNIETIRNLLDNEQSNPVLSNWYKNGYEEYAQLKELQDQGQNIDSMVQKLKENLETQKMVLLLSSDVYRKSETKYIWEINKIGSLLGLNDQNSNQDNEVEIEGGLPGAVKNLQKNVNELQNLTKLEGKINDLQALVDKISALLLARYYSPKEAALDLQQKLLFYAQKIVSILEKPENAAHNSTLDTVKNNVITRYQNSIKQLETTNLTKNNVLELQNILDSTLRTWNNLLSFFSIEHDNLSPILPDQTPKQEYMDILLKWRLELVNAAIDALEKATDAQYQSRNNVAKVEYLKGLGTIKDQLEQAITQSQNLLDQINSYNAMIRFFEIEQFPRVSEPAVFLLPTSYNGKVYLSLGYSRPDGNSQLNDFVALPNAYWIENPIRGEITDSRLNDIKEAASELQDKLSEFEKDEAVAPLFNSAFYGKLLDAFNEYKTIDKNNVAYMPELTESDFYNLFSKIQRKLKMFKNKVVTDSTNQEDGESTQLTTIKRQIQALWREKGFIKGQLQTLVSTKLGETQIKDNPILQKIKDWYDKETSNVNTMADSTVAEAYDKFLFLKMVYERVNGFITAANFFSDAGFKPGSEDWKEIESILNYPKTDPTDEEIQEKINVYEKEFDNYLLLYSKYDFWVVKGVSKIYNVFSDANHTEVVQPSDDLEANKKLIKNYKKVLADAYLFAFTEANNGRIYGKNAPDQDQIKSIQDELKKLYQLNTKFSKKLQNEEEITLEESKEFINEWNETFSSVWTNLKLNQEIPTIEQLNAAADATDAAKKAIPVKLSYYKDVPAQEVSALARRYYSFNKDAIEKNALSNYYIQNDPKTNKRRDGVAYDSTQKFAEEFKKSAIAQRYWDLNVPTSSSITSEEKQKIQKALDTFTELERNYMQAQADSASKQRTAAWKPGVAEAKLAAKAEFLDAMKKYYSFINDPNNRELLAKLRTSSGGSTRAIFDWGDYYKDVTNEKGEVTQKGFQPNDLVNFVANLYAANNGLENLKKTQRKIN